MSAHQQWDIVSSVGLTALVVAAGRAVDTHRPDALIDDRWAERFVQAAHPPVPLQTRPSPPRDDSEDESWQMMSAYMGVRSRHFDEQLLAAATAGTRQIVVLAAGLDARALRLPWPGGTTVYEVDQPAVLAFKDEVLAAHDGTATCTRVTVPVDLRDDWASALLTAGFDPTQPTAWLAEGLLPYLPGDAQDALLATVDRFSVADSTIEIENFANLFDQLHDPVFQRISTSLGVDMVSLLSPEAREDPADVLARLGWHVDVRVADAIAARYGRHFDPLTERLNAKSLFLHAAK